MGGEKKSWGARHDDVSCGVFHKHGANARRRNTSWPLRLACTPSSPANLFISSPPHLFTSSLACTPPELLNSSPPRHILAHTPPRSLNSPTPTPPSPPHPPPTPPPCALTLLLTPSTSNSLNSPSATPPSPPHPLTVPSPCILALLFKRRRSCALLNLTNVTIVVPPLELQLLRILSRPTGVQEAVELGMAPDAAIMLHRLLQLSQVWIVW